jgi:hypothetical protein
VTSDHGGTTRNDHNDPKRPETYRIPLFVWGPGIPAGADLYSLLSNRGDPGTNWLDYTAHPQPIRNGDAGNLALMLLGLPPIPGSFMQPKFVWDAPNLTLRPSGGTLVASWSLLATNFQLEASESLALGAAWLPVTDEVVPGATEWECTLTHTGGQSLFLRLNKPVP